VAQLLWQRVYGVGAAGAAWRDDAVRGGCVEAAARNVAAGRAAAASAGVLYALVAASPEARGALLAARPPALPALAAAAGAAKRRRVGPCPTLISSECKRALQCGCAGG